MTSLVHTKTKGVGNHCRIFFCHPWTYSCIASLFIECTVNGNHTHINWCMLWMSLAYITSHARMHEAGSSNLFCLLVCQSVSHYTDQVYISDVLLLVFAGLWEIHPWACGPEGILISLLNRCYTYLYLWWIFIRCMYMLYSCFHSSSVYFGVTLYYSTVTTWWRKISWTN